LTTHRQLILLKAPKDKLYIYCPVVLRPNFGHGLLILEVSWSHTTHHG